MSGRPFWCGESNRVLVVCRGLQERGWPVLLGAPADSAIAREAAVRGVSAATEFRCLRGFRPVALLRDAARLRRLHREWRMDVVHLHTSVDTWIAALAFAFRPRSKRPVLVRTRHSDHRSKADPVHRFLYRRVLDHVVLAAGALREPLSRLLRSGALTEDRITVIHSSVDIERFDPERVSGDSVRRELGLEGRFCIGLIGRVSSEKGHELLLDALPGLARKNPSVIAVFVGEGDHEAELRRRVSESGLDAHVCFAGFRSDIPEVMAAMDIVVAPSVRVEASPGVVKEGMAMARPVVAADVGGVSEIIRDREDGWIVPRGDASSLESALGTLMEDDAMCNALAARARAAVASRFSIACLVDQTQSLYLRLVECLR